ncbi:site-specific integrase [Vibrio alginolyticus]|uniref:site-specific integrase n=2 Tax=Vibrio TaxID=662 RepID=UPI002FF01CD5
MVTFVSTLVSTFGYTMPQDTKYLKKRKNRDVWLFSKRIPKQIQHLYEGKEVYTKSLKTSCIKTARLRRNAILAEMSLKEEQAIDGGRATFVSFYKTLKEAKEIHGYDPYGSHHNIDVEDVTNTNLYPEIQQEAFRAVYLGETPIKYTCTLRESMSEWLELNRNKNKDTISKVKSTTERFLKHCGVFDLPLLSIERSSVVNFIHELSGECSVSTIRAHLSRLKTVYKHAWDMGHIKNKDNPFADHSLAHLEARKEKKPKQLFSREQIHLLVKWADEQTAKGSNMGLLFRLGLFTGSRIGELCRIKVKDVYTDSGITAIKIRVGKTSSAQRTVPLTDSLASEVKQLTDGKDPESKLLGLNGDKASRDFSRFKVANVSKDSSQCFHSLRVHLSTAMLRAGIQEHRSAFIVGHEGGKTMTYGYYAKGDELSTLKEYVDRAEEVIKRDWLN